MTGISLPSQDFDHWWDNVATDARVCGTVGDGKLPACYCDSIDEFPELSLAFYRYEYKIPAEVYILYEAPTRSGNKGLCVFEISR